MKAYHGNPELKAQMIAGAQEHQRLDRVMHMRYWSDRGGRGGKGGGCAVGCTVHTVLAANNVRDLTNAGMLEHLSETVGIFARWHDAYPKYLGIPSSLAHLEEYLFEQSSQPYDLTWPERFLAAIPVGADLSDAVDRFYTLRNERDVWKVHQQMDLLIEILQASPVPEPPAPEEPTETVSELIARVTAAVEEKEAVHA